VKLEEGLVGFTEGSRGKGNLW